MCERVVSIEADMRVISTWRSLADHEAKGTGIPAGAVWRYEPEKFVRWLDAEKHRAEKKRGTVAYNAAGENADWDMAHTPAVRYLPDVPEGPAVETRLVLPTLYAPKHEVAILKSPRKQVRLDTIPWLSGDGPHGTRLELSRVKGENAIYWPGQGDIRPDGTFYGGMRDRRPLERAAIEAHRRLAVINGRTSVVHCLESELTDSLIV